MKFRIILAVALIACFIFAVYFKVKVNDNTVSIDPTIIRLDESFNLKIGQIALFEREKIKIKFVDILEDSRCPSDVQCIWAGQVKVALNVDYQENNSQNIDLILSAGTSQKDFEDIKGHSVKGYSIILLNVEPYPNSANIEKTDYTVSLNLIESWPKD